MAQPIVCILKQSDVGSSLGRAVATGFISAFLGRASELLISSKTGIELRILLQATRCMWITTPDFEYSVGRLLMSSIAFIYTAFLVEKNYPIAAFPIRFFQCTLQQLSRVYAKASIFLISAIAFAGFKPFGHVREQLRIV